MKINEVAVLFTFIKKSDNRDSVMRFLLFLPIALQYLDYAEAKPDVKHYNHTPIRFAVVRINPMPTICMTNLTRSIP